MGTYLLHCDKQYVEHSWDNWLHSENNIAPYLAVPEAKASPVWLANEMHTLFSLQFKINKGTRNFLLIALGCCLVFCELIIWGMQQLFMLALAGPSNTFPVFPILFIVILFLFWLFSTFGPVLLLGGYSFLLHHEETEWLNKIKGEGKAIRSLTLTSHRALFPVDVYVIQSVVLTVMLIQISIMLGFWGLFIFFTPFLVLIFVYYLIELMHRLLSTRALSSFSMQTYKKLELLKAYRQTMMFNLSILAFYYILYYITSMCVAVYVLRYQRAVGLSQVVALISQWQFIATSNVLNTFSIDDLEAVFHQVVASNSFIIPITLLGIALLLVLNVRISISSFQSNRISREVFLEQDIVPNPMIQVGEKKFFLLKVYVLVNSLYLVSLRFISVAVLGIVLLDITNHYDVGIATRWFMPFVGCRVLFEIGLGNNVGSIAYIGVLLLAFAPLLLWLLQWLYSLVSPYWSLFRHIPEVIKHKHQAKKILRDLCQELHIPPPLVYVEMTTLQWPRVVVLLPVSRCCVISVSNELVNILSEQQLRAVLALQLAYIRLYAKKMWWLQLLSRVGFAGPGYLTLLQDYQKFALKMDGFAVDATRGRQALIEILEKATAIESQMKDNQDVLRSRRQSKHALMRFISQMKIINKGKAAYEFYFSDLLNRYLYPSPEVRLRHLRYRFDLLTEKACLAFILAYREARHYHGYFIDTLYLLLGLITADADLVEALRRSGVEPDKMRNLIESRLGQRSDTNSIIPNGFEFAPDAERVMELAEEEARYLGHNHIDTIHLLLGLMCEDKSKAANVLNTLGIGIKQVRYQMRWMFAENRRAMKKQNVRRLLEQEAEQSSMHDFTEALTNLNRVVVPIRQNEDEKNVRSLVRKGSSYFLKDDYPKALIHFNRAIALDGQNVEAIQMRGLIYMEMDRYIEALADFDQAISLDAQNAKVIANRGETYRLMGRYSEALADFDRAIALDEQYAWAIASRGQVYKQLGRYNEALVDFDHALALDKQYKWAFMQRGLTYRGMERYSEALADFGQAISLDAQNAKVIANRGETYRLMGRYSEALADFDRAIALDEQDKWAIGQRGETYRLVGRYSEALADFDRAIALDGQYDWAIASRGQVYKQLGRYTEALTDFDCALTLDEHSVWVVVERGETYFAMQRYNEALVDLDRALVLDEHNTWAIGQRGLTYRRMKRYSEALADFDRFIALDEQDKWAFAERGETYRLMSRYSEALADFDRAIALDGQYEWAIGQRGETYRLMSRYSEALADFDRAITLDKQDKWATAQRGETYRLMSRYTEALTDFDRAIALDGQYKEAFVRRGLTLRRMERHTEALAELDQVIVLDEHYAWAIMQRGLTYRYMGHYPEALADLDRALALNEQYEGAIAVRGEIYRLMGRYTKALVDFKRVIALDDKNDWYWYCQAQVHFLTGAAEAFAMDIQNAIERVQVKLQKSSDNCSAGFAWALYQLMNRPEENVDAQYNHFASICLSVEDLQDAIGDLTDFLTVLPNHDGAQHIRTQLQARVAELKQQYCTDQPHPRSQTDRNVTKITGSF